MGREASRRMEGSGTKRPRRQISVTAFWLPWVIGAGEAKGADQALEMIAASRSAVHLGAVFAGSSPIGPYESSTEAGPVARR